MDLKRQDIAIVPSAKDFEVGSMAEFLVQVPFAPAEGVYLIRRGGIVSEHRFSANDGTAIPARTVAAGPPAEPTPDARGGEAGKPIALRSDFEPLALFAPETTTDAAGPIRIPVRTGDNLTRYRVMAVTFSGATFFGTGESSITARLPLMVSLSAPRFLNFGDRFDLPVVIRNQTDKPLDVQVVVRASNATLTSGSARTVRVPANDRVETLFPAAADKAGIARFQAGAAAGSHSDATEVSLPVWTPATTEANATYGEIDSGAIRQPVQVPLDTIPSFGGLDIQTSSTQLQALTDAIVYLVDYPFECSEQIASRILASPALKDVLGAFSADGLPTPEALLTRVSADIARLKTLQGRDGGFACWRRDDESWPFLTVHVTHALARAQEKGFDVPAPLLEAAHGYLRNINHRMTRDDYTLKVKRSIESYPLYVRHGLGDADPARARTIIRNAGGLDAVTLDVVGWLYPVLSKAKGFGTDVAAIRKHLRNRVTETAAAANFTDAYADGAWLTLHSNRRLDGLRLEGLISDQPTSDLIAKLVRGLLAHRSPGHWGSTQENAWVLLGLDRYFQTFERITPDFVARAWLGDAFVREHRFASRTTERHDLHVPMQCMHLNLLAGPRRSASS